MQLRANCFCIEKDLPESTRENNKSNNNNRTEKDLAAKAAIKTIIMSIQNCTLSLGNQSTVVIITEKSKNFCFGKQYDQVHTRTVVYQETR